MAIYIGRDEGEAPGWRGVKIDEDGGARANKQEQHADICEPCRRGLLSWWRVGSDKCSDAT